MTDARDHPFHMPRPEDFRRLLGIAVPIVLAQTGLMLMNVVDVMIVGRLSSIAP